MSLGFVSLRSLTTLAVLTVATCLVPAARATGGPYVVRACNDAVSGSSGGWTQVRTASPDQLRSAAVCPSGTPDPYGPLDNGLAVGDEVNAWDEGAPDGAYAEWRFSAPPGTAIVAARISRDIGNRDEWTPYGRIDDVDQEGESCVRGMNQSFCRIQGTRTFTGLNAGSLAYGIRCVTAPYCAHLWDLRAVWVLILGATVTLDDREAPTVSAVERVGLADGRWWNRVGPVSFVGHDNTGIRRRAVLVGGVVRAVVEAPESAAGGCRDVGLGEAYSFVRPCADGRGLNGTRSVSVNPCAWGDGVHGVRGRVTDTGGLETVSSVAVPVRVDCTAPVVTVDRPGAQVVVGEVVEPVVVASDSASGLSTTDVQVRVDDGPWQDHDSPVVADAGLAYVFRARASDAAGNWSAWAESEPTVGVAPPPPLPPPPPPPDRGEPDGEEPAAGARPPLGQDLAGAASPVERLQAAAPPQPAPPLPTARQQPQPHPQPAALRITRVLTRAHRTIEIAGIAATALTARATLTVRTTRAVQTRRVRIHQGRWRARLRTATRRARVREVVLTTPATATHAPGRARWRAALALHPAQ